jgi:hypothetical protein
MPILGRLSTNVLPLFYEEARVARYAVLPRSIGGVTAPGEGDEIIGSEWAPHFNLPGILVEAPAVIFFTATPHDAQTRISVRVASTNDHLLLHTFADGNARSWHFVIRPFLLKSDDNEMIFAVYDGTSATFSDAVILYTSNELTIKKRVGEVFTPQ